MSLYHHVKDLVSTEIGHWNRNDVVLKIDKVCKRLIKTSEIKRVLENAKQNILSDNLSDANNKLLYVKKMENLEQRIKTEEKPLPIKRMLATAATILTLGMYNGNAKATTINYKDANGNTATGTIVNNQVYNKDNQRIGEINAVFPLKVEQNQSGYMRDVNNNEKTFNYSTISPQDQKRKQYPQESDEQNEQQSIQSQSNHKNEDVNSVQYLIDKSWEMIKNKSPPYEIKKTLEKAIKLSYTDVKLHYNIGAELSNLGDYNVRNGNKTEAINCYKLALKQAYKVKKLNPNYSSSIDMSINQLKLKSQGKF